MKIISGLGVIAAVLTSLSLVPQIQKAVPKDSTGDLSLKMLVALFSGLALWIVYGLIVEDVVIVIANCVGVALVAVALRLQGGTSWRNDEKTRIQGGVRCRLMTKIIFSTR